MKTHWFHSKSFLSIVVATVLVIGGLVNATPAPAAETTIGNNLSKPAIWSEGTGLTLRGTYGAPVFDGATADVDGTTVYLQQDENNTWQAETADASASPVNVSWVDWGDNLSSKSISLTSPTRVETVLLQDVTTPMTGFETLLVSGSGTTEMWGATTATYTTTQALVYSANAHLTIQRLNSTPDQSKVTWNPNTDQWDGDASVPTFSKGVWESTDGPGGYAAEINISGGIAYGYIWRPSDGNLGPGYYRLTFSLDSLNAPTTLNTFLTNAQILPSTEATASLLPDLGTASSRAAAATGPVVDPTDNLSYVDVLVEGTPYTSTPTSTPSTGKTPVATSTPVVTATPTTGSGNGWAYHANIPRVHGPSANSQNTSSFSAAQSASYTSGIQVQNESSTTANAQAIYYDDSGNSLGAQNLQIPANGSVTLYGKTMAVQPGFVGSAYIGSDQPIRAISNMLGSNPTSGEAYNGISDPTSMVNIPLFQQGNAGYNTSLYIQDASGSANNVTVRFNSGGNQVSEKVFPLGANASLTVDQANDGITGTFVGSASVTAQQPIAVVANQSNEQLMFMYTGSESGAPNLYAPLIMTNNHGWTTGFQVENVGSAATTASLSLNGGSTPVATANLAPGQSVTWYPVPGTSSTSSFVGSAKVTSSNDQPLMGVVNELNSTGDQGMAYSAFTTGSQTVDMPLIMFNNSGYFTGEQIQNVGSSQATVDFKVNGSVVQTQVIQPGQSYTWYGTNLIPGGGKVASAQAVARESGSQIAGIVNEVTSPQQPGDTSFAYEGFGQ